jgi:type I restriction enzyme S subunit
MMAFVTTENIWFMYYLSQTVRFSKYAQVGALPSCNGSDIGDIKVEIPTSASEQKKITDFLTVIDQTITAEAEEITRVEQWKKGLMQKMFV